MTNQTAALTELIAIMNSATQLADNINDPDIDQQIEILQKRLDAITNQLSQRKNNE
ncbi:MAG: hypothetical protein H6998_00090 [Hahellaceae bacterium]|nr:hypothetical protein [Hahellaceae bacterium]